MGMNNAAKTTPELSLGTTPSGKTVHYFVGSGGKGYPLCGQSRGTRGNGRYRPAYGQVLPTCLHCAQRKAELRRVGQQ